MDFDVSDDTSLIEHSSQVSNITTPPCTTLPNAYNMYKFLRREVVLEMLNSNSRKSICSKGREAGSTFIVWKTE